MTLAKSIATVCLAAGLCSCATMEPHYTRPADAVPSAFPVAITNATAGAGVNWADVGYQDFFADTRLRQVIATALENNRDLRIAIANIQAARAQYRVQRSELVPTVGGNASADISGGTGNDSTSPNRYQLSVGVSSYELDLWGRIRSLSKSALEQYLATEEAALSTRIVLVSAVATAWLQLAADRTGLKVAQDTLRSSQESVVVAKRRLDAGVASGLDLQQATTIVAQAEAAIAQQKTAVAQDKNALDLLVGAPVPETLLAPIVDDKVALLNQLPANLASDALLKRPDVLAAEHRLRSSNFDIGAARAAFFPTISLTGSVGTASTSLSGLFSGLGWSFGPGVTLPFLDGGRNRANLDFARAQNVAQVATYERTVQIAFREVADGLARRGTIDDEVAANAKLVAAAAASLKLSRLRYDVGIDTYLNVLEAQRTLFSAQQSLVTARLARAANTVTLYQVLGGGVR